MCDGLSSSDDDQGTKSGMSPNSFKKKRGRSRVCAQGTNRAGRRTRSRENAAGRAFVQKIIMENLCAEGTKSGRSPNSFKRNAAGRAFVHRFSLRSSRTRYRSDSISGFRHPIRSWPVGSCRNEDNVYLLPS